MLAARAWMGLGAALAGGCGTFVLSYYRTLRKIVEQPDIAPGTRRSMWLPSFGGAARTAIVQFSIRTLFRSRQHRVILAFWAGMGFAILILFLKTPFAQQIAAAAGPDPWHRANVPVIASSLVMLCFWVLGVRIGMGIPVELGAHWVFRIVPLPPVVYVKNAIRAVLYTTALAPLWLVLALVLLFMWPPGSAAGHLLVYALVGASAIELCLHGFRKIPFTCSYLPGKSNLHMTVCLCLMPGMNVLFLASEYERRALADGWKLAGALGVLAAALWAAWERTRRSAESPGGLIFEEEQPAEVMSLGLFRDGFLPEE